MGEGSGERKRQESICMVILARVYYQCMYSCREEKDDEEIVTSYVSFF
jgi:hypothetical protein